MSNLEIIAQLANQQLKAEIFKAENNKVSNVVNRFECNDLDLIEDIESKMYVLQMAHKQERYYSLQEAVKGLIDNYQIN